MEQVFIDSDRCTGCGLCLMACGRKLIAMDQKIAYVIDPSRCSQCGHCKCICPADAPELPRFDPQDFIKAPTRDEMFSPPQLLAFLRARRSIRLFTKEPVEHDAVMSIIDAARSAPTAQNRQALQYTAVLSPQNVETLTSRTIDVLTSEADRLETALEAAKSNPEGLTPEDLRFKDYPPAWRFMARLREEGIDPLFHNAPGVIICHVNPVASIHPEVEAGMATMQMALMAEALGLGSCFCGLLDYALGHSPELKRFLNIPQENIIPVSFMLGYPAIHYRRLPGRNAPVVTWL